MLITRIKSINNLNFNKIISQNLLFSNTLLIIIFDLIYSQTKHEINDVQFIIIEVIIYLFGTLTLYNHIIPYLNNFENPIKQGHFFVFLITNISLLFYVLYFDYTQIKTFGLSIWMFLLITTTFWQLYHLDKKDEFPIIGKYFTNWSNEAIKNYNEVFPSNKDIR